MEYSCFGQSVLDYNAVSDKFENFNYDYSGIGNKPCINGHKLNGGNNTYESLGFTTLINTCTCCYDACIKPYIAQQFANYDIAIAKPYVACKITEYDTNVAQQYVATLNAKIEECTEALSTCITDVNETLDTKIDTACSCLDNKIDTTCTCLDNVIDTVCTCLDDKIDTTCTCLDNKIDTVCTCLDDKIDICSSALNTRINSVCSCVVTKSSVSVSAQGTATDVVKYITVDGVEKKLPSGGGGGGSVDTVNNIAPVDGNVTLTGSCIPVCATSTTTVEEYLKNCITNSGDYIKNQVGVIYDIHPDIFTDGYALAENRCANVYCPHTSITYDSQNSQFIALLCNTTSSQNKIVTSTDGIQWQETPACNIQICSIDYKKDFGTFACASDGTYKFTDTCTWDKITSKTGRVIGENNALFLVATDGLYVYDCVNCCFDAATFTDTYCCCNADIIYHQCSNTWYYGSGYSNSCIYKSTDLSTWNLAGTKACKGFNGFRKDYYSAGYVAFDTYEGTCVISTDDGSVSPACWSDFVVTAKTCFLGDEQKIFLDHYKSGCWQLKVCTVIETPYLRNNCFECAYSVACYADPIENIPKIEQLTDTAFAVQLPCHEMLFIKVDASSLNALSFSKVSQYCGTCGNLRDEVFTDCASLKTYDWSYPGYAAAVTVASKSFDTALQPVTYTGCWGCHSQTLFKVDNTVYVFGDTYVAMSNEDIVKQKLQG